MLTRRRFFTASAAAFACSCTCAAQTTRPNIAVIDRARILAAASAALARTITPDLLSFTLDLPALTAAAQINPEQQPACEARAAILLQTFLLRQPPAADLSNIADRSALAEVAVALPFLAIEPALKEQIAHWLNRFLTHLTEDREILLARDARDHNGTAWLLLVASIARALGNDAALNDCRHRYKTTTIRAQINAAGLFPQELTTDAPYRNSLFTLDLLAGCCQLLSTRFDSVWDYELQDGPGMRAAIASHARYIRDRASWPYPADQSFFHQLPARRPALVFAARAYSQADYATLWQTLTPDQPAEPDLLRRFPIRQPLLWLTSPKPRPV